MGGSSKVSPSDSTTPSPLRVLIVDHSGMPGGGQLGLSRYLTWDSSLSRMTVFLAGGPIADRVRDGGADTEVLGGPTAKWAVLLRGRGLRLAIKKHDPDVILANSMKAGAVLASLRRGRATRVLYLRDDLNKERMSRLRYFVLAQLMLRRFDAYLANSNWTASTVPSVFGSRPLAVAYPVSGTAKRDVGTRTDTGTDTFTIVSLSRLAKWKGIHVLIAAAARLSGTASQRFRVKIAGEAIFEDAEYVAQIKSLASQSAAEIEFVGHIDDVDELLSEADVLVSCSITPEPFGQVVAQGLSRGLVVVATDQGGPVEMIQSGVNGILVPPGNADDLAKAILSIMSDPALAGRMGAAAASSVTRYADEETAPALDRALVELHDAVGRRKRAGSGR